eukprot:6178398-Pleurochrysis_carterae.AAC.1
MVAFLLLQEGGEGEEAEVDASLNSEDGQGPSESAESAVGDGDTGAADTTRDGSNSAGDILLQL